MPLSRRRLLAGAAALAGAGAVPALLSACAAPAPTPAEGTTLGSNFSDPVPKAAMQAVVDAFTNSTGIPVRVNTVDRASFQDQIGAYLQGTPDDVVSWFAGYRMRFFAEQGLVAEISDIWKRIADRYSPAFRAASTGTDGREYFVPFYNYPWVVVYRKTVFAEHGYQPPGTWQELLDLAERMREAGLVPFAFGDRDGWPAMGMFDILNMRLNGYDFHVGLLAGREQWTDRRVEQVFDTWRTLLPYHQVGALGRTWQEAARSLLAGEAGMYYIGTFAGEQATAEQREDLDFFTFPLLGTAFDEERALDAPVNGFMLSRSPKNREAAAAFLEYVSTGEAQNVFLEENPNHVAAANDADTSGYNALQRKSVEIIDGAGRLAQFFDRDTRPDFSGPNGMQAFLQDWLTEPEQDLEPFLRSIQDYWDSLID